MRKLPITVFSSLLIPAFAQAAGAGGAAGAFTSFVPLILIFAIMYFLLIRPQQKKVKEHKAMLDAVKRGDVVVTNGGIIGKVTRLSEGFLHIEIANNVEVQIQRSAVVQVLPKGTAK